MFDALSLTTERLSDVVFDRVAEAILDGELREGANIRDTELAKALDVSRMPVREALQRLARIGVIEMVPSRFTRVVIVTPELAYGTLQFAAHYEATTASVAAVSLEGTTLRRALVEIDDMIDGLDGGELRPRNVRRSFHRLIIAAAGNPFLRTISQDADIAIVRNISGLDLAVRTAAELADNLRAVREAFAARDSARAAEVVRRQYQFRDLDGGSDQPGSSVGSGVVVP